ncbi:MAG: RNA-binding S4 domain-containing protein [Ruminococcaceae bacterium]|nr:RNA-binding S4 domain-containing protein [Oscillospiraceae bacterium]
MRLDKYLKVSRLIKRRTVANEACENGKIVLNGRVAKPSADVKEGDIIELTLGERVIKVRVVKITEHVMKSDAVDMYEVIS